MSEAQKLISALVNSYKSRQLDFNNPPEGKTRKDVFQMRMVARKEAIGAIIDFMATKKFTGVDECLSPIALMFMMHHHWIIVYDRDDLIVDANRTDKGFDGAIPQDLKDIFEEAYFEFSGIRVDSTLIPVRPNWNFSQVTYEYADLTKEERIALANESFRKIQTGEATPIEEV